LQGLARSESTQSPVKSFRTTLPLTFPELAAFFGAYLFARSYVSLERALG
jgi:hypothetical protein